MEKIRISFSENQSEATETIRVGNKSIDVNTFISLPLQGILIGQYCGELVDESFPVGTRTIRATIQLYLSILNFMTNLEIEDVDDYTFPLDEIVASGLYNKILEKITNYKEFESVLQASAELTLRHTYSKSYMGFKLENIIDKVENFLNKVTEFDFDKESLAELLQTALQTQKDFNDKYQIIEPLEDIAPIIDNIVAKAEGEVKKPSQRKKKS